MPDREPRRAIITLTTDFGLADHYVGTMKGVIAGLSRDAAVVDISHDIAPQRLLQAVFVTQAAWPFFPDDAVHVVVVDPGVGSGRKAVALSTPRGRFVGPDNGVLSAALPEAAREQAGGSPGPVALPPDHEAYEISERRYALEPVSATFHGRDVFAPAAAHLSLGVQPSELGPPVETLLAFPPLRARRTASGALAGQVVHVDRYGNAITDMRAEDLPEGAFIVELAGAAVPGPVRTYADASGLAAIVGSTGYLGIALPSGNAAEALGVGVGAPVTLRPGR